MTSAAGKRPLGQSSVAAGPQLRPKVLAGLLILRLAKTHNNQTNNQPDKKNQALEPAWNIAFGPDSGSWLTWVCVFRHCMQLCPDSHSVLATVLLFVRRRNGSIS